MHGLYAADERGLKIHFQKAVLTATRGERKKMEYSIILVELSKIRALLGAAVIILLVLFCIAILAAGIYIGRRIDRWTDKETDKEQGP